MNSQTTRTFRADFRVLPAEIRHRAKRAYQLWKSNPQHPSLSFKRVNATKPYYSIRIGRDYRVVGRLIEDTVYWEFIGAHDEYMTFLGTL